MKRLLLLFIKYDSIQNNNVLQLLHCVKKIFQIFIEKRYNYYYSNINRNKQQKHICVLKTNIEPSKKISRKSRTKKA